MRKRRYEPQPCNDGKNIVVWDNYTEECLGFTAQIVGRLNLQNDIIYEKNEKTKQNEINNNNRFIMIVADLEDGKEVSINDTEMDNAQMFCWGCHEDDLFFLKQEVEQILYRLNFQNDWINKLVEENKQLSEKK